MALKSGPRQASNPKLPPTNLTTSTALLPLGGEGGRRPDEGASAIQRRPAKPFRPRARLGNSRRLCTTAPFSSQGVTRERQQTQAHHPPLRSNLKFQIRNLPLSAQPSTRDSTKNSCPTTHPPDSSPPVPACSSRAGKSSSFGRLRIAMKVSGTNGTVVAEVISSTVFTQFFLEDVSRLLHKRIAVAAAFDYARLKTAGAVADSALGDAFQKLIANSS